MRHFSAFLKNFLYCVQGAAYHIGHQTAIYSCLKLETCKTRPMQITVSGGFDVAQQHYTREIMFTSDVETGANDVRNIAVHVALCESQYFLLATLTSN